MQTADPKEFAPLVDSGKTIPPVQQIADNIPTEQSAPKRRGRPPKVRPAIETKAPETGVEAPASVVSPQVDVELVKKTVQSVIGAIDGAIIRKVYATCYKVSKDDEGSKELARTAGITKDEVAVISECAGVVCQKYNVLGQYAPEIMLLAVTTGYGIRVAFVFRKLNTIIAAQAALLKKTDATESQPN